MTWNLKNTSTSRLYAISRDNAPLLPVEESLARAGPTILNWRPMGDKISTRGGGGGTSRTDVRPRWAGFLVYFL